MRNAAVFLDRDGVIIEDVSYLSNIKNMRLLHKAAAGIRLLNASLFKVIVVTNQSAIARGMMTEAELKDIHRELVDRLLSENARIDHIYYCPHHPDGVVREFSQSCSCRKPLPGMIIKAANDHEIDLRRSYMIGDSTRDIDAGIGAGCIPIMISKDSHRSTDNIIIKSSLFEAAEYIISRGQ